MTTENEQGESDNDNIDLSRDLGPQPIVELMQKLGLKPHDMVEASPDQLTHKMISRAMKGRRLTSHTKMIVQRAMTKASGKLYKLTDLFNYR